MSYFGVLVAVIIPLCQASPIGHYMNKDFEPPAFAECPGPINGFYLNPYGDCDYFVECTNVGTSMEMATLLPCVPGSPFLYPSVCEECGKKNPNEDKDNGKDQHKSTPTTTPGPTTPTTPTKTPTAQSTAMDTTAEKVEATTKGHSPVEEASTHMFTQTSGQVSENEVTTKGLPGKMTTASEVEKTTEDTKATVTLNVQFSSSEPNTNTKSAEGKDDASTSATATEDSDRTTKRPCDEEQETEGVPVENDASTTSLPNETDNKEGDQTTDAKVIFHIESETEEHSNHPQVSVAFTSMSDQLGHREEAGQEQGSLVNADKDIDSSGTNIIEVTPNIIKPDNLSDLSDSSETKTTSSDLDQFTTSASPEQS